MDFAVVLNQVVIIFLIIIIGYIAARLGFITREVRRGIIELLVEIIIPAMIIVSFDTDLPAATLGNARVVLAFSGLSMLASAIIGHFLFRRLPDAERVIWSFSMVFTNCAFIGYPLMESIFGAEGVVYVSIYSLFFNVFLWTYGRVLFTGLKDMRQMAGALVNAGTVSVLIGLVLLLTPLKLPFVISRMGSLVGSATTPLAMMAIGAMLAEVRLKEMFRGRAVFFVSLLRLVLFPAASFAILRLLGAGTEITAFCTIITALPVGSNAVIFANKFNGDAILATRVVVITTAFSILTVPLLASLIV